MKIPREANQLTRIVTPLFAAHPQITNLTPASPGLSLVIWGCAGSGVALFEELLMFSPVTTVSFNLNLKSYD
jgi:hypothetical protein